MVSNAYIIVQGSDNSSPLTKIGMRGKEKRMNKHILKGNQMLATAERDGSEIFKRRGHIGYSFKRLKDVSRVANEYLKALSK